MAVLYSPPINIIRYSNGTMVRLTASRHEFVSYDYDPETQTGTFLPDAITVKATLSGALTLKEWQYSNSGDTFSKMENVEGVTVSGLSVVISPDSALFRGSDTVTIRAVASDDIHDDTVTISRIVDPKIVYNKTYTSIEQTNDKIALIASQEQLAQLSEEETFISRYSEYVQEAGRFRQTVESSYATKTYADNSAGSAASSAAAGAVSTAKAYTDGKLQDYSTTTQMQSEISQSERDILLSVSETYASKTYADTKAGAAQSAAVSTAKGYTDQKTAGLATESYADNAASGAETAAKGYADNKLESYSTTREMNSAIQAKADEINLSVQTNYATKQEMTSATAGMFTLQTPYTYSDGNYKFEAKVFQNSEDITGTIDDGCIEWFKRSERYTDQEYIKNGKTMEIADTSIGAGGTIVCRLTVLSEEFNLTTETDAIITEEHGTAISGVTEVALLITETTLYKKDYLADKFAEISVTEDKISSEISRVETKFDEELDGYVTTQQWASMEQTVEGINTEVGKKVGTDEIISRINQSPERILLSAEKIDLEGAVTMDDLSADFAVLELIEAGEIKAVKIDLEDLFAQNITASGTITGLTLSGATVEADEGYIGNWIIDEDGFLRNESGTVFLSSTQEAAQKAGYPTDAYIGINGFLVDGDGNPYATNTYSDVYNVFAKNGTDWTGMTLQDVYKPIIWSNNWQEAGQWNYELCVGDADNSTTEGSAYFVFRNGKAYLHSGNTDYNILTYFGRINTTKQALEDAQDDISDIQDDLSGKADRNANESFSGLTVTGTTASKTVRGNTVVYDAAEIRTDSPNTLSVNQPAISGYTAPQKLYKTSSSSKRYKDHVSSVDFEQAKKVLDIPVVNFKYKDGYLAKDDELNGKPMPGLYAEDVEKLIPEAVYHLGGIGGEVENWKERIILPLLLRVVQEQQKEIDELKNLIKEVHT